MRSVVIGAISICVAVTGCDRQPQPVFPDGPVSLTRLNPEMFDVMPDPTRSKAFGFEVLAHHDNLDPAIIDDVKQALSDSRNFEGTTSSHCFEPRLAIHFGDDKTGADYVICTECRRIDAHYPDGSIKHYWISESGVTAFDRILNQNFSEYSPKYGQAP